MPIYHSLGKKPSKRHTIFEKPNGGYYYEQLFGTEGFHGMASLLYHTHRPTEITQGQRGYRFDTKNSATKKPLVHTEANWI